MGIKFRGLFEISMVNLFWGFGFVATVWALESFSLLQILALRFSIVGLVGVGLLLLKERKRCKELLKMTFVPALLLMMELLFQAWGLKHTSATKAGFITIMYIVLVPMLEGLFWKRKIRTSHWLWVSLAVIGTLLIVKLQSFDVSFGDFLMLISALGASLHILSIDRIGKDEDDLFVANTLQSFWAAIIVLPILLSQESLLPAAISWKSAVGLTSLTLGTTLLGFYFQMRAQKTLSPSISSMMFLLESPISAGFAYYLLAERLNILQWTGCALILLAALGVTLQNQKEKATVHFV